MDVLLNQADALASEQAWRQRLATGFAEVEAVFPDRLRHAQRCLSEAALADCLDFCAGLGRLGRGPEPQLAGLEVLPVLMQALGAGVVLPVAAMVQTLQRSPNGRAIAPLLQSLPAVVQRLPDVQALKAYGDLVAHLVQATSVSIHGRHATEPSPSLIDFLSHAPPLLSQVPLAGLRRWMDAGIRAHGHHPQRQKAYFSLQTEDSRALLQQERHGTLMMSVEARLSHGLLALWRAEPLLAPIPMPMEAQASAPMCAAMSGEANDWVLHLPEVLEDRAGQTGLMQYRLMAAHMALHRAHSRPLVADNWSPLQRLAVECFEDARIDRLMLARAPGLTTAMRALHPCPDAARVDAERQSGLRVRLTRLSWALLWGVLDDQQGPVCERFNELLKDGPSHTRAMADLALSWVAQTRLQSDQRAQVVFEHTEVPWRDDNRHLWTFIEDGDEEDTDPSRPPTVARADEGLPPRRYPEWDAASQQLRPDWTSVFDGLAPAGDPSAIDRLLRVHRDTAKRLERLLDALKPQDRQRLRAQTEGSELDLDAALRALIDAKACQQTPTERVFISHQTQGRDMAVMLLLDLSASVNDEVPGAPGQTVLSLTRVAVALLAQALQALGDQWAVAGFHSNTRHEVRFWHIKGFGEHWQRDPSPKARLSGVQAAYSTRMGAALRHAGHLLSGRKADKRLLLVLTDGQPADVDSDSPLALVEDAAQAVRHLRDQADIYTHCVSVDARADDYVQRVFGARHSVIDRVEQLPQRLPDIFMALTR